jgi:hypothetical protein
MKYRAMGLLVAVAAVVLLLGTAGAAQVQNQDKNNDKNAHTGKLVKVTGNQFTMTIKGKEHKHILANDAKVTCDGKTCKLDDLKTGITLTVTTRPGDQTVATRVEATTKPKNGKGG